MTTATLTEAQTVSLRRFGVDVEALPAVDVDAIRARNQQKVHELLSDSYTFVQVASLSGVSESDVTVLCVQRKLFSFIFEGEQVFPAFQFDENFNTFPLWGQIAPAIQLRWDALAVVLWFTSVNANFVCEGEAVSPVEFLWSMPEADVAHFVGNMELSFLTEEFFI